MIDNPNEVNRLNNRPNGELNPKPVGTGMMLWVHPGDVIKAEVFVKYADFDSEDKNIVAGLAGFLTSTFGLPPGTSIDMQSIFKVVEEPGFALLPAWSKLEDEQPRAFLNYLMFDNNFQLQDFDFDQVTSDAQIPIDGTPRSHEKLMLDIPIQKEGFLYIYVSNESDQNMDVYFDDLRINHTYSDVVAGGDYYPYGLAIEDRQIQRELYRFGYQGQFSEKDEETGWNHFELREYDPVIGRWTAVDPQRQFFSPYVGMGNNPVNRVDPNGGFSPPSTDVQDNGDGTYTVVGGNLTDGDLGIYIVDANWNRTGETIGKSLFIDSFFSYDNAEGAPPGWYGIINANSNDGALFLEGLRNNTPTLAGYTSNWEDYNFKDFGLGGRQGAAAVNYRYRGSQSSPGVFGSARDFGNIGAGYVAGNGGLSYSATRFVFDSFHASGNTGIFSGMWSTLMGSGAVDAPNSQRAEYHGWQMGSLRYNGRVNQYWQNKWGR